MNVEELDDILSENSVLFMVSHWWNSGNYVKHLHEPLSKLMSEDDINHLDNYIRNHCWPEMEIEFANAIEGYIENHLLEEEE